jgi:hypothetical protein
MSHVLLHRHALESVFAFLSLRELSAAVATSQQWAAATRSMRHIDACVTITCSAHMKAMQHRSDSSGGSNATDYSLLRHVRHLRSTFPDVGEEQAAPNVSWTALCRLAERCPQLLSFQARVLVTKADLLQVDRDGRGPLSLPSRLQRLHLGFSYRLPVAMVDVQRERVWNELMQAIKQLSALHTLYLDLPPEGLSFSVLQLLPALTDLELFVMPYEWTRVLANEVRAVHTLRRAALRPLRVFLLPRHEVQLDGVSAAGQMMQWQDVDTWRQRLDEDLTKNLVLQLPSLTRMAGWTNGAQTFEWVPRLPNMTALNLLLCGGSHDRSDADNFVVAAEAGFFARIQSLQLGAALRSNLSAEDLAKVLSFMPRLHTLRLSGFTGVDSLQPLCALDSLVASLRHLQLDASVAEGNVPPSALADFPGTPPLPPWRLPPSETIHDLLLLQHLESLSLHGVLAVKPAQLALLHHWPSPIWPHLKRFEFTQPA